MLLLAADGPINVQRVIKRKLYEEFGIKVSRVVPALKNRAYRDGDIPKLPAHAPSRSRSVPQPPPRLLNQKCNKVPDGDKLHKVLENWKMPKMLKQDTGMY